MNRFARGQGTLSLCIGILLTLSAVSATAQPSAKRRNWIPSGFYDPAMGDLWSFKCPAGGFFAVFVDTMNDTATGLSNLDLFAEVVDSKGNFLVFGDEDTACSFTPTCGFSCPLVGFDPVAGPVPCGTGLHTIAIGSFPAGSCVGGGGYALELYVFNKNGVQMTDGQTALGGGAKLKSPKWTSGLGKTGPVIDDQVVPSQLFPIPDPTIAAPETEETEAAAEKSEAVDSQEAAKNSEAKKAEAVRAVAAKRGEAAPPRR